MDISVSIVTYNSVDWIDRCLDSLPAAAAGLGFEAIVVDNGSTDGTPARLGARAASTPWLRVDLAGRNLGFGAGHNRALRAAAGGYLLCLNPDAWLAAGAARILVETLDARPTVGLAGLRILDPAGHARPNASRLLGPLEFAMHNFAPTPSGILARFPPEVFECDRLEEVEVVVGSCLFFRADAFRAVGGFDEDYFMYQEAPDLAIRLRRAGWTILVVPGAQVFHAGNGSRQTPQSIRARVRAAARVYVGKHFGPGGRALAASVDLVTRGLRLDGLLDYHMARKARRGSAR